MRELFLLGFLAAIAAMAMRRPFLFTLAYVYIDIVAPQRLTYVILNHLQISLLFAVLAIGGWALVEKRKELAITPRQWLTAILLVYAGVTTLFADIPVEAVTKWDWVWKGLVFALFLPFTIRTRLRFESIVLFLTLSIATLAIDGGLKTVLSGGGGYGALVIFVDNNSGLYEGSIISTVAIASIPLILWLVRFGTIFPKDWRVKLFAAGVIFACLLVPIGTQARTGLVAIAVLGLLMMRDVKRRLLYIGMAGVLGLAAIPLLPASYLARMGLISGYQQDSSAQTRLAVWQWTWNYALDHPMGGGFEAYRQNRIQGQTVQTSGNGSVDTVATSSYMDAGRAYHSSVFEMLGEQGFPGLFLFALIHGIGLVRMERLRRRYREAAESDAWIGPLATALQHFQIVYLVGGLFVGIAFQSVIWFILAIQIALDRWVAREEAGRTARQGWAGSVPAPSRPALRPALARRPARPA